MVHGVNRSLRAMAKCVSRLSVQTHHHNENQVTSATRSPAQIYSIEALVYMCRTPHDKFEAKLLQHKGAPVWL